VAWCFQKQLILGVLIGVRPRSFISRSHKDNLAKSSDDIEGYYGKIKDVKNMFKFKFRYNFNINSQGLIQDELEAKCKNDVQL
jgi:hypothetical protein